MISISQNYQRLMRGSLSTGAAHRIFYVAKYEEAVYVLHAFEKRTRHTPQTEIVLARKRLADLLRRRAQKQEAP